MTTRADTDADAAAAAAADTADAADATDAATTPPAAAAAAAEPPYYDVTVVGAGVAGLTLAAALHQLRLSVRVLERRARAEDADGGADVALWPGAISLLKMLGVPDAFFQQQCFALSTVHLCTMDFERAGQRDMSTVLNSVDMRAVTDGSGEHFVLVARQRLMRALRALVPTHLIVYGARDVSVEEHDHSPTVHTTYRLHAREDDDAEEDTQQARERGTTHCVASRVVVGADGARSTVRAHVAPHAAAHALKYCGEVCYRGVLPLHELDAPTRHKVEKLFADGARDGTMRICYGAGLRCSFGYMSEDGSLAYWWVKQLTAEAALGDVKTQPRHWPDALRTLHDATARDALYVHRIEECAALRKWSSPRAVLVGDAAHALSPNMGQGACVAVEDALVLGTLLARFWEERDGHLEAFYEYEFVRRRAVQALARDTRRQLLLAQLRARAAVALRNWALGVVPAAVLQRSLRQSMFDSSSVRAEFESARAAARRAAGAAQA